MESSPREPLELSREERTVLAELLDRVLGDMSVEISHTDNRTFRAGVKQRRDLLRAVRARLDVSAPVANR